MMDELKQQFYEVMHKYQKPFSEEGVTANLTQCRDICRASGPARAES